MVEIISTKEKIDNMINVFKDQSKNFEIMDYYQIENKKQWVLSFVSNGNINYIDFYYKEKNKIRIVPRLNSVENSKQLMDFLQKGTFDADKKSSTLTLSNVGENLIDKFIRYLSNNSSEDIKYKSSGNHYTFESSLGDILHLTEYFTGKVVIQTRPFYIYSLLMDFLSERDLVTGKDIIGWTKLSLNIHTVTDYTMQLKAMLGKSYNILPKAVKKTMTSSYSLCYSEVHLEDYSVLLAGIFRGLEAFLKIILVEVAQYKLTKRDTFSMFHSSNDNFIGKNNNISKKLREEMIILHNLYSNKRNIYLHVPVITETAPILEELKDARSIADEILLQIKKTYNIIT